MQPKFYVNQTWWILGALEFILFCTVKICDEYIIGIYLQKWSNNVNEPKINNNPVILVHVYVYE